MQISRNSLFDFWIIPNILFLETETAVAMISRASKTREGIERISFASKKIRISLATFAREGEKTEVEFRPD